jgi:ADP-L-glycero-D-manno-heptose 6-epimerase
VLLVTGAAGFIGSQLVQALNRAGHDRLVLVDDLSDGSKVGNLASAKFADYLDKSELLSELPRLGKLRAILHQGATSSTLERDGQAMMANNYRYSRELLDFALRNEVPFLYASSAAVYGRGRNGFSEDAAAEPLNPYAFSKLAFDQHVRRRLAETSQQIVGLRYFNVYGPHEGHKGGMASLALQFFNQLRAGGNPLLFEGSQGIRRDFVYVDDVVRANLFFLESAERGIFNCGSGVARSCLEVARIACRLLGRGEPNFKPFPPGLDATYQSFTQADLRKLRGAGYAEEPLSLEEGMARYYSWLRRDERAEGAERRSNGQLV